MPMLKKRKQIDEKYRNEATKLRKSETKVVENFPNRFPEPRPGFSYSHDTCLEDIAVSLRTIEYTISRIITYRISSYF